MGLFNTNDRHEFKPLLVELDESPLSPLAHWVLWIVISFIILSGLWLYFAQIDVVVSAKGKVIPDGEIKIVQPIETGIISKILVREGDLVEEGQVLIEIDPSVTETNLESKKEHLELLTLECARLTALIEQKTFTLPTNANNSLLIQTQRTLYEALKNQHEEQIKVLDEQLTQTRLHSLALITEKNRINQLLKNAKIKEERLLKVIDIIARDKYEAIRDECINYTQQVTIKAHEITQNRAKMAELTNQKMLYIQQRKNELLSEFSRKHNEATQLKAEVESIEFKKAKQYITAPVKGHVGKLFIHTVGGVVTPAEKLMSIIPVNTTLILKVTVLNQDIGFIEEGMDVAIKVDTFTYQKYGLLKGIVLHVSNDAIEDEKLGLVYEVLVKPTQTYLEYKNRHHDLHIGMSVLAEMKVGKRRIIEFFIYPAIRYLDEGLSVR